ncbi:MAG: hypothetical protein QNK24_15625 [Desulfuromusa sp.]|nr:hypothetical protein [Desulfuromusa sp.]
MAETFSSKVVEVDGLDVLSVQCLTAPMPVFFRRDGNEIFYVRMGPTSRQLSPSELIAHVQRRENQH